MTMADNCDYEKQLREACRLVAEQIPNAGWELVYQSRSGPPQQPWLEPDIGDYLQSESDAGKRGPVIIIPIGFISDHMEVMFDLDEEAAELCKELGIPMRRAGTVGTHPSFIEMIVELVKERMDNSLPRKAIGDLGPWHDVCPTNCCLYPRPSGPPGRPAPASGPASPTGTGRPS
jgi:ferrochelatase